MAYFCRLFPSLKVAKVGIVDIALISLAWFYAVITDSDQFRMSGKSIQEHLGIPSSLYIHVLSMRVWKQCYTSSIIKRLKEIVLFTEDGNSAISVD